MPSLIIVELVAVTSLCQVCLSFDQVKQNM